MSFFGPFYGYIIFALDHDNYQYAMISGPDTSYLWILARQPTLSEEIRQRLVTKAHERGFDTNGLIFVAHDLPADR